VYSYPEHDIPSAFFQAPAGGNDVTETKDQVPGTTTRIWNR
jgi:hypothetical protein